MTRDGSLPSVTLVVAMRNEREHIGQCLASIAAQDWPAERLEVLVYDGQSSDDSVSIADRAAAGRPRWSVRENPHRIQAAAWNAGVRTATGDIVGIISGHAQLGPAYIRSAVAALERTGAELVGGPVQAVADGDVGAAIARATSTPFGVGGARHHYLTEPAEVDTVFMGIGWRETWLRYPFDEEFVRNQDDELSYRLLDGGGRIVCDPAIESSYHSRSTLTGLWRQYFAYGYWKVRVLQLHPRQARPRHLVPLGLVTGVGGSFILGFLWRPARSMALIALGMYGAAIVAAAARYRDPGTRASGPLLAVVYPILHVAYGTGMLLGHPALPRVVRGRLPRPARDRRMTPTEPFARPGSAG